LAIGAYNRVGNPIRGGDKGTRPLAERQVKERIEVNPRVHFGKPCVAGTRIPVVDVLELVAQALPFDQIIRDYYPRLEREDIQACIQYPIPL
jgi:uncharacterized protein (DUF433 family)